MGQVTPIGAVPRRLTPIFRDRDELPASGDLGAELVAALQGAMFLVVICSPASAKSKWVGEEIRSFKQMHGESRVLALIVGGEPYDSEKPGGGDLECFPLALRYKLGPDGEISDVPAEPIAADLRPDKDGKRLARLKLVAGLTGLRLDDIVQRENQRRMRQLSLIAGGAVGGMVVTGGLAFYANVQRIEAERQRQIAVRESVASRAASDFLVGTFQLANPATDNPRTITALTILARGSQRLRTELAGQPDIEARLLATVGKAYNNLGLAGEAQKLLEASLPDIRRAGSYGAPALQTLATAYSYQGQLDAAMARVLEAERVLGPDETRDRETRGMLERERARVLFAKSDLKGGLQALDHALALFKAEPSVSPRNLASALQSKGYLLTDDGQFDAADAALRESLAVWRRAFGDQDLEVGKAWLGLAINDMVAGRLSMAEKHIDNAIRIERHVLDSDNPLLGDAISTAGQIYQGQHKLDAASKALKEAIAIYEKAYRKPFYQTGITLVYLALVESEQGRTAAALADLDEAKQIYDASYGRLHPNHGDLLVNRARVLARAGRRAEAATDCAAGVKILEQTLGATAAFTKANVAICAKL